eukprot:scaffold192_cov320-Ochromonas_danica.AAC.35
MVASRASGSVRRRSIAAGSSSSPPRGHTYCQTRCDSSQLSQRYGAVDLLVLPVEQKHNITQW